MRLSERNRVYFRDKVISNLIRKDDHKGGQDRVTHMRSGCFG